ncbi:hypothetical protein PG993_014308 [Apiospora rasikravindrae]|uniref:Uncharacterized protein n=1 Tax=Apiospora rasikravindrae TaxID=990691 RepID=A0ABR1RMB5_9PEZI
MAVELISAISPSDPVVFDHISLASSHLELPNDEVSLSHDTGVDSFPSHRNPSSRGTPLGFRERATPSLDQRRPEYDGKGRTTRLQNADDTFGAIRPVGLTVCQVAWSARRASAKHVPCCEEKKEEKTVSAAE